MMLLTDTGQGQLGQRRSPPTANQPPPTRARLGTVSQAFLLNFHRILALASQRTELNKWKEKMFVTNTKEQSVCSLDTEHVVPLSEFIRASSWTLQGSKWQQGDKLLVQVGLIQDAPRAVLI